MVQLATAINEPGQLDAQVPELLRARKLSWQIVVVGLMWRLDDAGNDRLAVIEEAVSKWSLPRGRLCSDEWNPDAFSQALGLSAEMVSAGRVVHLEHDLSNSDAPLTVYWAARLQQHTLPGKSFRWFSPKKAKKRLHDPDDLCALSTYMATTLFVPTLDPTTAAMMAFRRAFWSPERKRLIGELRRTEIRLAAYRVKGDSGPPYEAALSVFSKALTAFYQHDREGCWRCLSELHRLELSIMAPSELAARRVAIEEEGKTKLNGWRSDAFKRLMKEKQQDLEYLRHADSLISDSQETKFFNISLVRRQANLMACVLMVLSILFLIIASQLVKLGAPLTEDLGGNHYRTILVSSFLLGSMGACVSALMSFSKPQRLRVPDRVLDSIITLVRPVIGGASALMSSFFLISGIVNEKSLTIATLFVVAFAFGFSERLVMSSVSRIK
jgi:hypothetical protein